MRTILHVDMDAFFVSVELLRRPELRGRPVVVGGDGARGVVAASSYEARAYGVVSAMPSVRARRLCPQAVFLAGDHAHYASVSARLMGGFRSYTPLVEPLSLDEAFLDVTGVRRLHGTGREIGDRIRAAVQADEGLSCSVGVAPSKFLAKLASKVAKPRASPGGPRPGLGVKVVEPGQERAFLHPLPLQALWGVGPSTMAKLATFGARTIGDLAALDEAALTGAVGDAAGRHRHPLARAGDDRPVLPERRPRSIGHEETFARDHHAHDGHHGLGRELVRLADSVAGRLRAQGLAGRTVTVKVRFRDFVTVTRSATLPVALDTGPAITRAARALLETVDPSPGVRLLGVTVTGLRDGASRQLSFDGLVGGDDGIAPPSARWHDASRAVDRVRGRFGAGAIGPAALAGPGGLGVKRRGDQQWGPSSGAKAPP